MVAAAAAWWTLQDFWVIKGVRKGKTLGFERGGTWEKKGKSMLNFSRPIIIGGTISISIDPIPGPPVFFHMSMVRLLLRVYFRPLG